MVSLEKPHNNQSQSASQQPVTISLTTTSHNQPHNNQSQSASQQPVTVQKIVNRVAEKCKVGVLSRG